MVWYSRARGISILTGKNFSSILSWTFYPCSKYSTSVHSRDVAVLNVPSASIFRFSSFNANKPVFSLDWTIRNGESWVVLGNAGEQKTALLETLKGQTRIVPPPPNGAWPFLSKLGVDPIEHVRSVSFAQRHRATAGGEFYDYSARYGAVREGDKLTLLQYFVDSIGCEDSNDIESSIVRLAESLELRTLLNLPLVALSNGQTRRARILKALLFKPKILILDEPLTGLDVHHRPRLVLLLEALHRASNPHIIMSLRIQDPVPAWVTHVALVQGDRVLTGPKSEILVNLEHHNPSGILRKPKETPITPRQAESKKRPVIIDLQNVNVAYHERHILKDITWTIREGERWLLRGENGSGKTTLLSIITGDHPQSYTQAHLQLFGVPRKRLATPEIARRIGISSPELFNAFPRRTGPQGLTVRDAIGTGFDGIFTYRKPTAEQSAKIDALLNDLGPVRWSENPSPSITTEFGNKLFASLTPGEQSLIILLRALVTEPQLLILDEAFSGMDQGMIGVVSKYLQERLRPTQSVVWVSHWDAEAPWNESDGVLKYTLDKGHGRRA